MASDWKLGIKYLGGTPEAELKEIHALTKLVTAQVGDIRGDTGKAGRRPQHAKGLAVNHATRTYVGAHLRSNSTTAESMTF
jgi:hypothetical protein